jgi:hypothetical protein
VWSFPGDHLRLFIHDPLAALFQHVVALLLLIVVLAALLRSLAP